MVFLSALVYAVATLSPSAQTTTADLIMADEQSRLNACLTKQEDDPEDAYEDGLAWLNEGNRPAARYCTATSLIALGQYVEGADRLEALAAAPDGGAGADRAIYLTQAGNAWMLAQLPQEAVITLTDAMKFDDEDAALYQDRARAYLMLDSWSEAESDLDQAIARQPGDIQSYILRGEARLRQDKLDAAMEDVLQARSIDETDIDALLLRGRVREAIRLKDTAPVSLP